MGTGPSSGVKNIKLEQGEENKSSSRKSTVSRASADLNSNNVLSPRKSIADVNDKDEAITSLTKQLCDAESTILDQNDKIQILEQHLRDSDSQNAVTEQSTCDETLHVKDQYIAKLEKDKKDIELETAKLKQLHRKKVKKLTSQMAEYKQETNFQIMELRDEILNLTEDNNKLQESPGSVKPSSSFTVDNTPKLPGGEKMKLILDLSEQVTEQEDKMARLEKKLKDKDHIIDELRVKLRNNSGYLQAVDTIKPAIKTQESDSNNSNSYLKGSSSRNNSADKSFNSSKSKDNSNSGVKSKSRDMSVAGTSSSNLYTSSRGASSDSLKKSVDSYQRNADQNQINALFAVQEEDEDEFGESAGMVKLSSLLKGVTAKKDNPRDSLDTLDGNAESVDQGIEDVDIPESGTGRDSGLGSAGKREEEKKQKTMETKEWSDWKDPFYSSGLSDSDFDTNLTQSKVSSAPPKLQNGGNARLKKKSNSLRKRSSNTQSEDRPPRPAMAFINTADTSKTKPDHVMNRNTLAPSMSPVQVS